MIIKMFHHSPMSFIQKSLHFLVRAIYFYSYFVLCIFSFHKAFNLTNSLVNGTQMIQCCINKAYPMVSSLSWFHPFHYIDAHFFKIHSNMVIPSTDRWFKRYFCIEWSNKLLKAFLRFSILDTSPVNLNILDLLPREIF